MQARSIIPQPPHMARPLGILRFAMLLPIFLISRVPLWFVIIACFLINATIGYVATFLLVSLIFISRSVIEAEFSAGEDTLSFYLIARIIKYFYYFAIIFLLIVFLTYIFNISVDSSAGKILSLFGVCLFIYLLSSLDRLNSISHNNQSIKEKEENFNLFYHLPLPYSIATNFLWFYLAFVPDSFLINLAVLLLIYIIEIYVLYNEKPVIVRKGSTIRLKLLDFDFNSIKNSLQRLLKPKAKKDITKGVEAEATASLNLEASQIEGSTTIQKDIVDALMDTSIADNEEEKSELKLLNESEVEAEKK